MNKPAELLPCPHCNGNCSYNNTVGDDPDGEVFSSWYECDDCGSQSPTAEVWNTRSLTASPSLPVPGDDERFAERMRAYINGMTDNNTATALELAEAMQVIAELVMHLETLEAHHVKQNRLKGRDETRSYTLSEIRAALTKARAFMERATEESL